MTTTTTVRRWQRTRYDLLFFLSNNITLLCLYHITYRYIQNGGSEVIFLDVVRAQTMTSKPTTTTTHRPSFPYIYAHIDDFNASYPVIEHIHPSHMNILTDTNTDDDHPSDRNRNDGHSHNSVRLIRPDFLFTPSITTNTYRVVEFYVHWCDVCKHFKSHYIQLGQRIHELLLSIVPPPSSDEWMNTTTTTTTTTITATRPRVEMYAVSCAPHRDLCRDLQIDQYPYFRIYRPQDCSNKSLCHTDGMDIPHSQINPTIILQQMGISSSSSSSSSIPQQPPTHVKNKMNLEEGMLHSFSRVWTRGMELFLQFVVPGGKMTSTNHLLHSDRNHIKKYEIARSRDELRDDIHTSFDYAMRYAVYTLSSRTIDDDNDDDDPEDANENGDDNVDTSQLSEERAVILNEWLHLLRKTLPISYTTLHLCIKSLIDHYDYVKRSELYMVSILDEYPPPKHAVWSTSCSYGMMDTGYTCGLWLLFHSVTVGVVDYNRNVAFPQHRFSTEFVARNIRNYIHTFFACEICRQNFVTTFDTCGHDRCRTLSSDITHNEEDWIQLPLWLFETHNAVNVRLLQEQGQRDNTTATSDDTISVIWPLQRDCPKCWRENNNNGTNMTTPMKRNDDIMYKFLKLVYGQRDALYIQFEEEIQNDISDVERFQSSTALTTTNNKSLNEETKSGRLLDGFVAAMASFRFHSGMILMLDAREAGAHRFVVRELMEKVFVSSSDGTSKQQPLTNTKSTILLDWLSLLRKTLPKTWHGLHYLMEEIVNNWTYVRKSKDYLFAIVSEHPPPDNNARKRFALPSVVEMSHCDEVKDYFDVLHIISVGVVHHNKYMALSDEDRLSTCNVIETIRMYTKHVFGGAAVELAGAQNTLLESMNNVCEVDNICDTSIQIPGNEQDWIALPMWTFRVHNAVLQRRETTTHYPLLPISTKMQHFPLSAECPKCWIDDTTSSIRWDDDYVYKYLLLLYGPESSLGVGLPLEFFGPSLWETIIGALPNIL